jgi:hypothetical protein
MPSLAPVMEVYERLYPASADWTRPFQLLNAVRRVRNGEEATVVAKSIKCPLPKFNSYLSGDAVTAIFKTEYPDLHTHAEGKTWKLTKRSIGRMLLGFTAEQAFERLYKTELGSDDLKIEDFRESRNDTDYRVFDKNDKALFRINIKAHASPFRNAPKLVNLPTEDCFPLGTYKIRQGLDKEAQEDLPYFFLVASVPGLTAESIGDEVPESWVRFAALVKASKRSDLKKHEMEDRLVATLVSENPPEGFSALREKLIERMASADWNVLSAKKAEDLLKSLFWERVYALTERGFAQNYPNAEVDMHFSISKEMTPLKTFLQTYKEGGQGLLMSRLAKGVF